MSNLMTTIAVIPRDPNDILDIIRCRIVAFESACGQPEKHLTPENHIETFNAIHPGYLEACLKESKYESIEEMVEAACKNLVSKNVIMKVDRKNFCYPIPEIPKPISIDSSILNNRMFCVYKCIFKPSKNILLPIEFVKIMRWYKYLYQETLTTTQLAVEFNLDPNVFMEYDEIIEKSGIFYVHQHSPLQIQAYSFIRVAMIKALTLPIN